MQCIQDSQGQGCVVGVRICLCVCLKKLPAPKLFSRLALLWVQGNLENTE